MYKNYKKSNTKKTDIPTKPFVKKTYNTTKKTYNSTKLSAGRVQTPTLYLIYKRNEEIANFKPEKYFKVKLLLNKTIDFFANRIFKDKDIPEVDNIIKKYNLSKKIKILDIKKTDKKQQPQPPFHTQSATSTIIKRFKIKPKMAASILQSLYEKGVITYHRTDSTRVSEDGINLAKTIINSINKDLFEAHPGKAGEQDAHEAIRITHNNENLSELNDLEKKVYELIKKRFLISQMKPFVYEETKVIFEDNFISIGRIPIDKGFKLYDKDEDEETDVDDQADLPELKVKEIINIKNIEKKEEFTQPPAYFSAATIINEMKKVGIGRPSTYASIIDILFDRNYISEDKNRLIVTDTGKSVIDYLYNQLKLDYIKVEYTKEMEEQLDKISMGKLTMPEIKSWLMTIINNLKISKNNFQPKY